MKLFRIAKDGGSASNVTGYWLIEWKSVFSIALLRFKKGSRDAYHSHAFNAVSWVLYGELLEKTLVDGNVFTKSLKPSFTPVITPRDQTHQVHGISSNTWALTFRGPWSETWKEVFIFEANSKEVILTNGRKIIHEIQT